MVLDMSPSGTETLVDLSLKLSKRTQSAARWTFLQTAQRLPRLRGTWLCCGAQRHGSKWEVQSIAVTPIVFDTRRLVNFLLSRHTTISKSGIQLRGNASQNLRMGSHQRHSCGRPIAHACYRRTAPIPPYGSGIHLSGGSSVISGKVVLAIPHSAQIPIFSYKTFEKHLINMYNVNSQRKSTKYEKTHSLRIQKYCLMKHCEKTGWLSLGETFQMNYQDV